MLPPMFKAAMPTDKRMSMSMHLHLHNHIAINLPVGAATLTKCGSTISSNFLTRQFKKKLLPQPPLPGEKYCQYHKVVVVDNSTSLALNLKQKLTSIFLVLHLGGPVSHKPPGQLLLFIQVIKSKLILILVSGSHTGVCILFFMGNECCCFLKNWQSDMGFESMSENLTWSLDLFMSSSWNVLCQSTSFAAWMNSSAA